MSGRTEHIKQIQFYGSVSSVAQAFVFNMWNNCKTNQTEPTWWAHLVYRLIMKILTGIWRVRDFLVIFFTRQLFWLSLCRAEWLLSSPNTVPQVRATSRAWANIRRKQSARIVRPSSRRSGGPRDEVKHPEKKKKRRTRDAEVSPSVSITMLATIVILIVYFLHQPCGCVNLWCIVGIISRILWI